MPMLTGKIKMLNEERGFGFILGDDLDERFFHRSVLDPSVNFNRLTKGQRVQFTEGERTDKGLRADYVTLEQ